MVGYLDIPGRVVRYVHSAVPSAPDDLCEYTSLSVAMDMDVVGLSRFWVVSIRAGWGVGDGSYVVSLQVPLRDLLSDEYGVAAEVMEPLW